MHTPPTLVVSAGQVQFPALKEAPVAQVHVLTDDMDIGEVTVVLSILSVTFWALASQATPGVATSP